MPSSPITCHGKPGQLERRRIHSFFYSTVLDSSIGKPAPGVGVSLQVYNMHLGDSADWELLAIG
jgi:hypothetical protein